MITGQLIRFKEAFFRDRNKVYQPKNMVYLMGFLYALHITPSVYIDSSFLAQFVGSNKVGYVFSAASLAAIIGIVWTRRFMQIFGNYITFRSIMFTNLICFSILSTHLFLNSNPLLSTLYVLVFIISFASRTLGFLSMDIFLERYSHDSETGGIRGIYLTGMNLAFMTGPILAALIINRDENIANTYVWAVAFAFIILYIARKYFRKFDDGKYEKSHIIETFLRIKKDKNLYNIFMCNLFLNIFYAIAVIYIPLFLYTVIGFSISKVALIVAFSQIPFVTLQIPMGKIADKFLGEKEILTFGFIVGAIGVFSLTLFSSNNFWLWGSLLLITRIGASSIEIMCESYLFKKIDHEDINILGLFRVILPFAYIITPIAASILLIWFKIDFIFLLTSFVLIYGIRHSLKIVDTR